MDATWRVLVVRWRNRHGRLGGRRVREEMKGGDCSGLGSRHFWSSGTLGMCRPGSLLVRKRVAGRWPVCFPLRVGGARRRLFNLTPRLASCGKREWWSEARRGQAYRLANLVGCRCLGPSPVNQSRERRRGRRAAGCWALKVRAWARKLELGLI